MNPQPSIEPVGPEPRTTATGHLGQLLFRMANAVQASGLLPSPLRPTLLRAMGLRVARSAKLYEGTFFGSADATIGERCFVSIRCFFDGSAPVTIGRDVHFAPGVQLLTSTHEIGPPSRRAGARAALPVVIGDGCWIGAGAMVMPGVTIASGCVVAARSIVTKDTQPDGLYVGAPARRVRSLAG